MGRQQPSARCIAVLPLPRRDRSLDWINMGSIPQRVTPVGLLTRLWSPLKPSSARGLVPKGFGSGSHSEPTVTSR